MGSHHKHSRRRKKFLPRLSTVILILVIGGAIYFFKEMYYVKEDVADQEQASLEGVLVKRQTNALVTSIANELKADSISFAQRALSIKNSIDSNTIARLDTFMLKNNRYRHLSIAFEEKILLPLHNDSVNYHDSLVVLMDEYRKVESLSIADSCHEIARNLSVMK